jgi:hypothetical protein
MPRLLAVLIVALTLCGVAAPALAASGTALGVRPDATAGLEGNVRTLKVGSDVSIGETVTTNARGLVQLLFTDGSKLVVGPNSSLVLEDYLVRNDNSAGRFAINTLAGTFRFVTGNAPKNAYAITTPTGTIGIRGTALEWTISASAPGFVPQARLSTLMLLIEGGVRICNRANTCIDVREVCNFGWFSPAGAGNIDNTRESRSGFRSLFPLANNPGVLRANFRVPGDRQCLNPPPNANTTPTALGDPGFQVGPRPSPEETTPPTTTPPTTTPPPSCGNCN